MLDLEPKENQIVIEKQNKTEKIVITNYQKPMEPKKGFFSKFFTAFSITNMWKARTEKQNETKKSVFYSNPKVKNERFIEVVNKVLKILREKRYESKKAKFQSIVDTLMSQKVAYMGHVSKSNNNLIKNKNDKMKRSISCPANLNLMRKLDGTLNNRLNKTIRLSCSYNENLPILTNETKSISKMISSSSGSSFESSSQKKPYFQEERPVFIRRYVQNNALGHNCNEAIVSIKITPALFQKYLFSRYANQLKMYLDQKELKRKASILDLLLK